jgi:hypothetical protein
MKLGRVVLEEEDAEEKVNRKREGGTDPTEEEVNKEDRR